MKKQQPKIGGKYSVLTPTYCLQGIDALAGVGKFMEGFAITLDSVIGQAFEEWGVSRANKFIADPSSSGQDNNVSVGNGEWEDFTFQSPAKEGKESHPQSPAAGNRPRMTSLLSKLEEASGGLH